MLRAKLEDEESILKTQQTVEALLDFVKEVHALAATLKVGNAGLVFQVSFCSPLSSLLSPFLKTFSRLARGRASFSKTACTVQELMGLVLQQTTSDEDKGESIITGVVDIQVRCDAVTNASSCLARARHSSWRVCARGSSWLTRVRDDACHVRYASRAERSRRFANTPCRAHEP